LFWASLTAFYGALKAIEWFVIALTRDHQDMLARQVSLISGVPAEDPDIRPRIRLDTRWIRKKIHRRIRATFLFILGLPALTPLLALPYGEELYSAAAGLWAFYWLTVFSLARTRFAWD